ncbi:hypothetical protein ACFV3R_25310 [Streptomyces sp. NPDC059740]|uniref:hypothetical protein n=1 Tax=Streptomyces sp. NPDC059740 TaxID=3346926 RepID=UPI0036534291
MPASKLQQDETRQRRTVLLRLRRQGVRFDDERILALGYASPNAARKDVTRALKAHYDEEATEVTVYRQQENERLDALLEAAWPRATTPTPVFNRDGEQVGEELDMRAVDTVLRLMDRRAKLNGLDAPVRTELSGPDGGAVPLGTGALAELDQLIAITGDTPTADPAGDAGDHSD